MASFTFNVEGQHLRETDHRIVVSGSVHYLSAEFTFSEDWGDIPKISFWTKGSVTHKIMLTDDKISPEDGIYLTDGNWLVSVLGEDVEGEVIKKRITTNEVYVHVEQNGPTEGDPFEDITPSIGEQIIGMANKSAEDAENSANEAARSASDAALHRNEAQQAEDQAEASAKSASKSAQDAYDSAEDAKKAVEDLPEKVEEYIDSHKEELKGEPGYTPQKGIDYFDGEPGYTPLKGLDYFDGYTPIKGIDYFDGEPGEPGPAYDDTAIKKEVKELNDGLANLSDEVEGKVGFTDYATADKGGVFKISSSYGTSVNAGNGALYQPTKTIAQYNNLSGGAFIGKGTLENVLADRNYASVFIAKYGVTTYDEIVEAFNAGKIIFARREIITYSLSQLYSGGVMFYATVSQNMQYCNITNTDTWSYGSEMRATEINATTAANNATYPSTKAVKEYVDNATKEKEWVLKGTIKGKVSTTMVDLSGCTEICVVGELIGAGGINVKANNRAEQLVYTSATGDLKFRFNAMDNAYGITVPYGKYGNATGKTTQAVLALYDTDNIRISEIFSIDLSGNYTSANVEIYAR